MSEDGQPIAYSALPAGVPVVSRSGRPFGTVERVLQIPAEDVFRGIVVATASGARFVDRDRVQEITTARVTCAIDDDQVAHLPAPPDPEPDNSVPERSSRFVTVAQCRQGALFETLWVPLVSVKAIRLGPFRIQRCPVHRRLELVRWRDPNTLTPEQRRQAARYPADRIP